MHRFSASLLATSALALCLLASTTMAQDYYDGAPAPAPMQRAGGAGTNAEVRLLALEDQLRAMTGKNEQLEYAVRRLDQTMKRMQEDYEARLAKLETTPPPPPPPAPAPVQAPTAQPKPAADDEPVPQINGQLGGLKVQGDKVTGATNNGKAPPLPATPADYGLTAQELYDHAFNLLKQANYAEAEASFKNFIDKYAQDKLIDNAKYWYGETFYVRGKFNEAAVAFADAFQQNPKGSKAPDSLLKLGMALGQLGRTDDACTALGEIKAKHTGASATLRARADQERTRLKCK